MRWELLRNRYELVNGVVVIYMTNNMFTCVSEHRLPRLLSVDTTWHANWAESNNTYFARAKLKQTNGVWKYVRLHRFITECSDNQYVLHLDNDGLNNLDSNLVITSRNRTGAKLKREFDYGVGFDERRLMWYAVLPDRTIGYFLSKQAAQNEYDRLCSRN